jgi:hypothetical protein
MEPQISQINSDKKTMENNKSSLLHSLFENDPNQEKINLITERIIGCAYKVANTLGCGFLEKVYENSLAFEIKKSGLTIKQQEQIKFVSRGLRFG